MAANPVHIQSEPGIQRDGTNLAGKAYSDGRWVRFQRGLPRKINGYQATTNVLPEPTYGMTSYSEQGVLYQHHGSTSFLTQIRTNFNGNFLGPADRTPATIFNPSVDNLWQFDTIADPVGFRARIVAHPGLNRNQIDNAVETEIFVGDQIDSAKLIPTAMDPVSGGIVVLYPYLLAFSNFGRVDVSNLEDLTVPPIDSGFVTGQKIIRGMSVRGGGGGPAGLLWSLDSLVRASFNSSVPSEGIFTYDTIADDISVLSSRGIIADMGIYYWAGVDGFYAFNGVVREIPNNMNTNFFFDNLNPTQRQKVFAYKVPRFGEIWWCFPKGNATECNHAVVYNRRDDFWYDTPLPNAGRSDGLYAKVYNKPFMTGIDLTATPGYTLWQHETGLDEINGSSVLPIHSFFETNNLTMLTSEQPASRSLRVARVEPDFVQSGNLQMTITGEANAKAPTQVSAVKIIPDTNPAPIEDQVVDLKDAVRRLLRFKFDSNTAGGNYEMGLLIAHMESNDGRITG
jgi:hypothetical protein